MIRLVLSLAVISTGPVSLVAQDYILRPGPRGFDSRLNRYGATERPAAAPTNVDRADSSQTNVKIELLIAPDGPRLEAQQWSKTLADVGYPARIRSPLLNDTIEITETTRGPLRFVTIIGALDRRGNLVFPNRAFSPDQAAELKEWLDDLKKFGAQGSPDGQPMWGLTRPQFEQLYSNLSRPVTADVKGATLQEALAKLDLPRQHPLSWNVAAKRLLDEPRLATKTVSRGVEGLTTGTALAFVLNEYKLGFRPERTPGGSIQLGIEPLPATALPGDDDVQALWPVGWDIKEEPTWERGRKPVRDQDAEPPTRVKLAPSLFAMTEIGMRNVPLSTALATLEEKTAIPVLVDAPGLEVLRLDADTAKVNLPTRRTSWSLALRSMTFPHRLQSEIRRDEAGNPLIWVTPMSIGR